jgi:uncharacterized membrane protein
VSVHGGHAAPVPDHARRVLLLARQRTIDQDPAFVLRMPVDIAIRALSPAVNDPTTALSWDAGTSTGPRALDGPGMRANAYNMH